MRIDMISGDRTEHEVPTVFDSELSPADPVLLARLRDGTATADLAAPPVVLPDFCHKTKSEMPSSIAVATRGAIRPTLTDAALNCGMALATLDVPRPGPRAVKEFYRRVRERFPDPPGWRGELTRDEVLRAAVEGADFRRNGTVSIAPTSTGSRSPAACPSTARRGGPGPGRAAGVCVQLARLRFGSIGPSTHFLELQEVEEVLDPAAAAQLGVHAGQVTLQLHNGGGVLTGQIGEMYARRRSASRLLRIEMAALKPLVHLLGARRADEARRRYALDFTAGTPSIPTDSAEGRRMLLAQRLAMNYGFAYRLATVAALRRLAREVFGARLDLVVYSPHNSVYEEEIAGRPAHVHRHNAARAWTPWRPTGRPPGLRRHRAAAAAARNQPHLLVPVRPGRRRPPQPLHGLPRHRQHHQLLRPGGPVRARPAGPQHGLLLRR